MLVPLPDMQVIACDLISILSIQRIKLTCRWKSLCDYLTIIKIDQRLYSN